MLALQKNKDKNSFSIIRKELPKLSDGEVLVKVDYCGICGSDLHASSNTFGYEFVPEKVILGHELSGEVMEVHDSNSDRELVGKNVVITPVYYCGECKYCKIGKYNICENRQVFGLHFDGGMSEYIKIPENYVIEVQHNLTQKVAALTEPMSIAKHAVNIVCKEDFKNCNVLVQGCGVIGLFTAISIMESGGNVTISGLKKDRETRLYHAEKFGIETEAVEETDEKGSTMYDIIFECSGSTKAMSTALNKVNKGGKIICVALYEKDLNLPLNNIVRNEIDIMTSYGYLINDFKSGMNILEKYKKFFDELISEYGLADKEAPFVNAKEQKIMKPIFKIAE